MYQPKKANNMCLFMFLSSTSSACLMHSPLTHLWRPNCFSSLHLLMKKPFILWMQGAFFVAITRCMFLFLGPCTSSPEASVYNVCACVCNVCACVYSVCTACVQRVCMCVYGSYIQSTVLCMWYAMVHEKPLFTLVAMILTRVCLMVTKVPYTGVTFTILADRLLTSLGQPQINPEAQK